MSGMTGGSDPGIGPGSRSRPADSADPNRDGRGDRALVRGGRHGLTVLGLRPDLAEATIGVRGVAAVFAGLGLAGLGGVVAALAMGVPGREVLARAALAVAILGMVVAAGVGTVLVAMSPVAEARVPFTAISAAWPWRCWSGFSPQWGWSGSPDAPHPSARSSWCLRQPRGRRPSAP